GAGRGGGGGREGGVWGGGGGGGGVRPPGPAGSRDGSPSERSTPSASQPADRRVGPLLAPPPVASVAGTGRSRPRGTPPGVRSLLLSLPWQPPRERRAQPALHDHVRVRQRLSGLAGRRRSLRAAAPRGHAFGSEPP